MAAWDDHEGHVSGKSENNKQNCKCKLKSVCNKDNNAVLNEGFVKEFMKFQTCNQKKQVLNQVLKTENKKFTNGETSDIIEEPLPYVKFITFLLQINIISCVL